MAEELIFRRMLHDWPHRRLPILVAAAIQAPSFARLHHYARLGSTVIAFVGICLWLFCEWGRSSCCLSAGSSVDRR